MKKYIRRLLVLNFFLFPPIGLTSQESGLRLVAEPAVISLEVGSSAPLIIRVLDASGALVDVPVRYAAPRQALRVRNGMVQAFSAGNFEIIATAVLSTGISEETPTLRIPVSISWPGINTINLNPSAPVLFVGTTLAHHPIAIHADGTRRPAPVLTWTTSDPSVASVDPYGAMTGHSEGTVTLTVSIEETSVETLHTVRPFPATELLIEGGSDEARTGDVLRFSATGLGPEGRIEDLPVTWAYTFIPDDSIKAPGSAAIMNEGSFVAEVPGRYTVLALSGSLSSRKTVLVHGRGIVQPIELQGQGAVRNSHTSDLWVFEGLDGRDYAI
ncbi:MAG: Ig-like domain-containing protein, partial [Gemmatimonadota bacterium]|nr:Ig-like domain-containing protein [Gemmatimonadota bacterium]